MHQPQRRRLARADQPSSLPPARPSSGAAAAALYSTGPRLPAFLRMLLHGGSLNGAQVLRPETVALMDANHIGDSPAGVWRTALPELSNDVDLFPGMRLRNGGSAS